MSKSKTSSLEKIGYIKKLPKDAHINDYEKLIIHKNGNKKVLYRLNTLKKEFDETSNFKNSWDVFNSYLT